MRKNLGSGVQINTISNKTNQCFKPSRNLLHDTLHSSHDECSVKQNGLRLCIKKSKCNPLKCALANSVDPDEMPQFVASHLSLHSLLRYNKIQREK